MTARIGEAMRCNGHDMADGRVWHQADTLGLPALSYPLWTLPDCQYSCQWAGILTEGPDQGISKTDPTSEKNKIEGYLMAVGFR